MTMKRSDKNLNPSEKAIREAAFKHLKKDDEDKVPIKTVLYVPHRSRYFGRFPIVTVHKHPRDGRYVVVEQRAIHTNFSDRHHEIKRLEELEKESGAYDPEVKFRSLKPAWKWGTKGNRIERSFNRSYQEPYLPPIDMPWSADAKVGSLDNADHIPGGGLKKVPNYKLNWEAKAKVGSLDNVDYDKRWTQSQSGSDISARSDPSNGVVLPKIKTQYRGQPFLGPLSSKNFVPGGTAHLIQKKNTAKAKVGSLDNINYETYGGKSEIPHFGKPKWKTEAKVGSLDKIFHKPGGGDVVIPDLKPKWKSGAKVGSLDNVDHIPNKQKFQVPHFQENWKELASPKVGSMENADHVPKGGDVSVYNQSQKWTKKSKIDHLWKKKPVYVDPNDIDYDEDKEIEARIRAMLYHGE
ncbi:microtubule-associated protein tau-like isoform X1 [Pecten maximus]|uniref:microtubule-associated protein tau-like isoform X1 n=1 Tax=Pecten maximus TaxID=6579 RepID=UPI00145846FD|nr:microtubule-associated protein tau-like isoform X1 [Pecten maximus]